MQPTSQRRRIGSARTEPLILEQEVLRRQTAGLHALRVCETSPDGLVVWPLRMGACMAKASGASMTATVNVWYVVFGAVHDGWTGEACMLHVHVQMKRPPQTHRANLPTNQSRRPTSKAYRQ